ncbi:MAG TPA: hypothetical protein VI072_12830 [Polyangiaceae bacterium]
MRFQRLLTLALPLLCFPACSDDDGNPNETGLAPSDPRVQGGISLTGPYLSGDCDPLTPSHCGYPFPSNVYLVADDTGATGRRVQFGMATLPKNSQGVQAGPDEFARSDGFSAGAALMTHLPGATTTGLATPLSIESSLFDDSPTVVINAATGQRVPHFAELDMSTSNADQRAFMIRPVVRLDDATRYIVAIRRVMGADGTPLPASEAFAALRDGTAHADASIETRRPLYADIFARLSRAGVTKSDLQIAWDVTTASLDNNTRWMLHLRDQALSASSADGPAYTIDTVQDDPNPAIRRKIEGKLTVPLYLDQPGPGGKFVFGADGMPVQNGTAQYPFVVLIPRSATAGTPGVVVQNGHGLFGRRSQVEGFSDAANQFNWVLVATDFIGMSTDDLPNVATIITGGNIGSFRSVSDRLCQGFLNMLLVTRMVRGGFARDPNVQFEGKSAIDTSKSYYFGGSQGGIMGGTFMALTQDIQRGALAVPGQPYNLLLNRSVDFDPYFAIIQNSYPNALDIQLLLGLVQMQWDRSEPTGYAHHIANNPLPGTPAHSVLMQVSIGDHQVSTLGAHIMARAIGAKHLKPVNRSVFGLEEVDSPYTGSAMIEYDFGLPPEPITNVPMREGEDPHGKIKGVPAAGQTLKEFLETGVVRAYCDGPCNPG